MKIVLLGAAGFIGTNIVINLAKDPQNEIIVVDKSYSSFQILDMMKLPHLRFVEAELTMNSDYTNIIKDCDLVYHLVSTTVPTTSNQYIAEELKENIVFSTNLFEACVYQGVKKVVFISSGGAVYGKESECPLNEKTSTNPITSYGIQKITIEKLLYLFNYMYDLDYRIVRLANPYGPYQCPNGVIGAVTTFIYKALKGEEINVYGDGSIVRDFIYIDDAVKGIQNIVNGASNHRTFNLGCGYGTSIMQLIEKIKDVLDVDIKVRYMEARTVDVPVNYLDIERYETAYGCLNPISLEDGIKRTADFIKEFYSL